MVLGDTELEAVFSFGPIEWADSKNVAASEPDAPLKPEAELVGVPISVHSSLY